MPTTLMVFPDRFFPLILALTLTRIVHACVHMPTTSYVGVSGSPGPIRLAGKIMLLTALVRNNKHIQR